VIKERKCTAPFRQRVYEVLSEAYDESTGVASGKIALKTCQWRC
jgi:hypothetical protein